MSQRNSKFWFKNEKEVMRKLGLEPQPGSGSRWTHKEDGINDYLMAQLKSTESESTTIKLKDWESLEYNAAVSHKVPVFVNQFMNGPLLLTIRYEDLEDVYNYLARNVIKPRAESIIKHTQSNIQKPSITTSTKRESIKEDLKLQSSTFYKRRK